MHAAGPRVVQTPRARDQQPPSVTDRSRAIPARLHRPTRLVPGLRVVVEHDAEAGLAPLPTARVGWNRHLQPVAPARPASADRAAPVQLQDA